ncbi:hypothetical protein Hypma_001141 [Hypsizygus marmoreus]|uniref:Uncharacterized protein n=1 Tax=Hypsizygus marmoreus TaxID=39966 RepID=A0A369J680_HYPMA|nr:hypothetical protein Hypma_001141 [Hypsizygus marmoreus]
MTVGGGGDDDALANDMAADSLLNAAVIIAFGARREDDADVKSNVITTFCVDEVDESKSREEGLFARNNRAKSQHRVKDK